MKRLSSGRNNEDRIGPNSPPALRKSVYWWGLRGRWARLLLSGVMGARGRTSLLHKLEEGQREPGELHVSGRVGSSARRSSNSGKVRGGSKCSVNTSHF